MEIAKNGLREFLILVRSTI